MYLPCIEICIIRFGISEHYELKSSVWMYYPEHNSCDQGPILMSWKLYMYTQNVHTLFC